MSLTVGGRQIADVRVQGVTLRPIIGGYELMFALYLYVNAFEEGVRRASIMGARVTVRPSDGEPRVLGFARPEDPLEIVCMPFSSSRTPNLPLQLQPGQIAALETLRGTGDLTFEFLASGSGTDEDGNDYVQGQWNVHVAKSDWIKKLRDSGAGNVLLLEVPLPLESVSQDWLVVAAELKRAEEQYRNGDYHSCISSCRTAIGELGRLRNPNDNWTASLRDLAEREAREAMNKSQREHALLAALRNYGHLAHHGASEGGVSSYTRAEAQFVFTLTAAAVAHAQAG